MKELIKHFREIGMKDIPMVGGKNASLGELYNHLKLAGIRVPDGFAITSFAFERFLTQNSLHLPLFKLMELLDRKAWSNLREIGAEARKLILKAVLPSDLTAAILNNYIELGNGKEIAVAVRSSATAEDLPQASFAGQHESYLNIKGEGQLITAVHNCFASLYTDRAIKYREDNGFAHEKVLLSVGIQRMVRSDKGSAGVAFTLEPESGFRDVIHLSGVWGLGENIVQGIVNPDEFLVFKPGLRLNKNAIIQKKLGDKLKTLVYSVDNSLPGSTINLDTSLDMQRRYVLDNNEIVSLAKWCLLIEEHYGKPMDIEWAKDGITNELFIVQARPETVHSSKNQNKIKDYVLKEKGESLAEGSAIGAKIVSGVARIITTVEDAAKLNHGEIIVTDITTPDWDPMLKRAAAIITNKGGRTSHASIVARELGVPAIVGCGNATESIKEGEIVTVSCAEGKTGHVYKGGLEFEAIELDLSTIHKPESTEVMLIVADPDQAFKLSFYPNDGVGLMRMEFIISHLIQAHPMALVKFNELKDEAEKKKIESITYGYSDKKSFFIDKLSQGIATIAAAFYPRDVIVRLSDFKTNEYANLIGGKQFEPVEENPMLGFRGASRYYNELYKDGFRLECASIIKVREEMGLTNVKVMVPFCRTVEEAKLVLDEMSTYGLSRDQDNTLEIYMMVEIPSNVLLADEFAKLFDGFSIGSNDLTQLVLGTDRDSEVIRQLFDEQNPAVKQMIASVIRTAKKAGIRIGLCGQAPSDYPAFASFLVNQGIDSISFNPDAMLKGIEQINAAEQQELILH